MIDAVIFDMDGSLIDSMWVWKTIDREYLGRFQITLPHDLHADIEGMTFHETAVYFKKRFEIPDDIEKIEADWTQMSWDKYTYEVPLKEGVEELLNYCKEHGILMGIATSNSRKLAEHIIAVHHLEQYFTCIMTGGDVERGKPAPDIYLAVAKGLNAAPANCLVFEDIVSGILAGKAAGMQVCAVYDEFSKHQDEEKRRLADYYTYCFRELTGENGIFTD